MMQLFKKSAIFYSWLKAQSSKLKANSSPRGMSTLIVVIVVSVISLLIVTTRAISGIQEVRTGLHEGRSQVVLGAAEGCLEQALLNLKASPSYSGESLTFNGVACVITVTGSGTTRTIRAAAQENSNIYVRALEADVDWSAGFQVLQWREINL